jgi:hypothetical protein
MIEHPPTPPPEPPPPAASPPRNPRARSPLYRTVLSIAVASIVAAWLPFSVLYISALSKHAHTVATVKPAPQTASPTGAQPATQPAPVTTRTS